MPLDAPGKRPATPSGKDGAGAGRLQGALAVALVLVLVGGIGYFALHEPVHARPGSAAGAAAARQDPADARRAGVVPAVTGVRRKSTASGADHDPGDPNDLANYAVPGQPAPTMGEVISGLHKAGIRTGLGAFNPPGTSPPLVGLAVPEDYPLPEGYVRHFQATDDGQAIEPILMYSPDYEFLDAAGQAIEIPADRVVRVAQAPAGLPIRQVRIPPPQDPDPSP
jgi:hypothetical protein